jgi:histidinol-phosphate aminotransferase
MAVNDTDSSADRTLAALRQDIDAIDDEMHSLLMKRAEIVRAVGGAKAREDGKAAPLFRPGREASILRRLIARNRAPLPDELVVRIWRDLIAALTRIQGPFEIGALAARGNDTCLDLARGHFGSVSLRALPTIAAVLSAVSRHKVTLAVLPPPGKADWWAALPKDVQILARLPFLPGHKGRGDGVVIGKQGFELSGDDRLYLSVTAAKDIAKPRLAKAGLKNAAVVARTTKKRRHVQLIEVDAGAALPDVVQLAAALEADVRLVGGYARPIAPGRRGKGGGEIHPRPGILSIEPYVPGRSQLPGHQKTIKLSSNESALGPSPKVVEAIRNAAPNVYRYPDGGAEKLRDAIGKRFGLDPARIVCGTGSDELIGALCRAYAGPGDEILYTVHGFSMYPILTYTAGATPVTAPEKNYTTDVDALLRAVTPRTKAVFIANPNNPTGTYISAQEMKRLRDGLPEGCLLVIDSAYAEYVAANDYSAGVELVDGRNDTIMLRTFSKMFALGGIRIGWGYGPPAIIDVLNRVRGTFNIASVAQAAGIAALEDTAHFERSRAHNDKWLPWFISEVRALGLEVVPSVANFALIGFPATGPKTAPAADAFLNSRGIIVRGVRVYNLPNHLRVTIGTEEELRAVVAALAEFMK